LVEKILEADGITKEMIESQQKKLELLQRLSSTSDESIRLETLNENEELVDGDLFNLLSRLLETAAATGDEQSTQQLEDLQSLLLEQTKFGQQVKQQSDEVQAAVESLQKAGRELTREKLLEIVIDAPNAIRLSALVSLARPGMDYTFFQLLTDKIDQSSGEEKERLTSLRDQLLDMTRQVDQQVEARSVQARQLLNKVLEAEDAVQALTSYAPQIDEFFVNAIQIELDQARKAGDLERINKLNQLDEFLKQASAQPPEIQFLEELLDAPDEESRQHLLEENKQKITPEFFQFLSGLMAQIEDSDQEPELKEKIKTVNRQALRYSMQMNLQG
jgi:uncharacterized protein YutE (UPF0331/DUF86 family)